MSIFQCFRYIAPHHVFFFLGGGGVQHVATIVMCQPPPGGMLFRGSPPNLGWVEHHKNRGRNQSWNGTMLNLEWNYIFRLEWNMLNHQQNTILNLQKGLQKGLLPALKPPIVCIYSLLFVNILHDLKWYCLFVVHAQAFSSRNTEGLVGHAKGIFLPNALHGLKHYWPFAVHRQTSFSGNKP